MSEEGASLASVALILSPIASADLEMLFIRRAEHPNDPWSGHIGLPGGRLEKDDEDRLSAAVRETKEEVGIALPPSSFLGELDDVYPGNLTRPPVLVRPFVFALPKRPKIVPSAEVAGHFWTGIEALRRSEKETTVFASGTKTTVQAFCIGSHSIWGLTHRIVTPLLELFPG